MNNLEEITEKVKKCRNQYESQLEKTNINSYTGKEKDKILENIQRDIYLTNTDFAYKYPAIFKLIFNSQKTWETDYKKLLQMIKLAKDVKNGKKSRHDASVQVGTDLVDTYVKPKLKKKK